MTTTKLNPAFNPVIITFDPLIANLKGTVLDDAQYISFLLEKEISKNRGRVVIGTYLINHQEFGENRYTISIVGNTIAIDSKGKLVNGAKDFANILEMKMDNEINFDTIAYIEVQGRMHDGRSFYGTYYSLSDVEKHLNSYIE